jgi:peptidoglycan/xylan/chitin deacetylase (PgdA/CDA1 family)
MLKFALRRLSDQRLSVFLFHKVPTAPDELRPAELTQQGFESALDFISENFKVIPLSDAVARIGRRHLQGGLAAITFDDGYVTWPQGVASTLLSRGLPATFFITTGQLQGDAMWNERLSWIIRNYPTEVIPGAALRLPDIPRGDRLQQQMALSRLEFHFKYLPPLIREEQLQWLEQQLPYQMGRVENMTEHDVRVLANHGFEIGGHTVTHPILAMCDRAGAMDEITKCKEHLENICRIPVRGFAYPNGRSDIDFSRLHVQWAKEAGYSYAVTSQPGIARHDTPIFQIPRFTPWGPSADRMTAQMIRRSLQSAQLVMEPRV